MQVYTLAEMTVNNVEGLCVCTRIQLSLRR